MKRLMALDVGERRIGIALSDPLGITAQPHAVLDRGESLNLLEKLREIIREYGVTKIIAGMPYDMDGEQGKASGKVNEFIGLIRKNIGIEVETFDERFSTAFSEKAMLEANASRKTRRRNIDKVAAAAILQGYLDRKENQHWL